MWRWLKLLFICLVSLLPSVRAVFSPDTKRELVEALEACIGTCTAKKFAKLGSSNFDSVLKDVCAGDDN